MKTTNSCPICAEDFTIRRHGKALTCCKAILCQSCLYSHIKSVLEEGITGDGRKKLSCPFGCGGEISDLAVRESFRSKHTNCLQHLYGRLLLNIVVFLSYFHRELVQKASIVLRVGKSSKELDDLQLYERWSLSVALSSLNKEARESANDSEEEKKNDKNGEMDASSVYVHVIQCPQPDCECIWLVNKPYRNLKLGLERSFNKEKRYDEAPKGFTKSLILSCYSAVLYKPIPPEKEESMMNANGYTIEHWMNPIDVDPFSVENRQGGRYYHRLRTRQDDASTDGRMVSCPGCNYQFCGLCSRPWCARSNKSGKLKTHRGKLCSLYGKKVASDDDGFLQAADAGDARLW